MPPRPAKGAGVGRGGPTTASEVERYKQCAKGERLASRKQVAHAMEKVGDALYRNNEYFALYKDPNAKRPENAPPVPPDYQIDKFAAGTQFDGKTVKDTCFPAWVSRETGLQSTRPVTTSQDYGWLRPIDTMTKLGNSRAGLHFDDPGHLGPR